MQPHQERVVTEKTELDERLGKLTSFFETQTFAGLANAEQARLSRQAAVMREYSDVLAERIAAF